LSQDETAALAEDGLPARLTGKWVFDKKYYFERYLDIFTHGVGKKWNGQLAYADLFSGPGKSLIRETSEEIDGSPLIALRYDFARYVFVDVPEVIAVLRERLKGHPKCNSITFIEGDCNTVVDDIRAALPANHLNLAFIDPTGLQIRFRTISKLVENRKIDLLMTIQFGMGIRMNITLPRKVRHFPSSLGTNPGVMTSRQEVQYPTRVDGFLRDISENLVDWDLVPFEIGKFLSAPFKTIFFSTSWFSRVGIHSVRSFGVKRRIFNRVDNGC
jgi:three-Cys-motif partner protein